MVVMGHNGTSLPFEDLPDDYEVTLIELSIQKSEIALYWSLQTP